MDQNETQCAKNVNGIEFYMDAFFVVADSQSFPNTSQNKVLLYLMPLGQNSNVKLCAPAPQLVRLRDGSPLRAAIPVHNQDFIVNVRRGLGLYWQERPKTGSRQNAVWSKRKRC